MENKKIYFAADFHLGYGGYQESLAREKKIIAWLSEIEKTAAAIYFLGDIFEFWFEYTHAVPKYFLRFFAKLLELKAKNIEIHFLVGNHDLWMKDYFEKELEIQIHHEPLILEAFGKKLFLAHGDGLGKGDQGYKILKKIFLHPFFQTIFRYLSPEIGMRLAFFSSKNSRKYAKNTHKTALEKNQKLIDFASEYLENYPKIDFFVFGHQHAPILQPIEKASYCNLGDWIYDFSYGVLDEKGFELLYFS